MLKKLNVRVTVRVLKRPNALNTDGLWHVGFFEQATLVLRNVRGGGGGQGVSGPLMRRIQWMLAGSMR